MRLYQKIKSQIAPNKKKLYDSLEKSWKHMGENDPFYSVITNNQFKSENVSEEVLENFYFGTGSKQLCDFVNEQLKALKGKSLEDFKELRGLDFGCGVGRNSIHLAPYFKELVGLDISEGVLLKAREICQKQNIKNIDFYKSNDQITTFGKFDFIFSVITLQHIPPPLMKDYIHQLLSMLNPKGFAFLQLPIAAHGYRFLEKQHLEKEKKERSWNMHILPEKVVRKVISKENCTLLNLDLDFDVCGGKWKSAFFTIEKNS